MSEATRNVCDMEDLVRSRTVLTEAERTMLTLERHWPTHHPSKDAEIGRLLGLTSIRYYRALSSLIETERAVAFDPLLVARLRRMRDDARRRHGVTR